LAVNIIANVILIAVTLVRQVKDYWRKQQQKIEDDKATTESQLSPFKKRKLQVGTAAADLEQNGNNDDSHLRSEGSLRSPGMPLPPSLLLQAPDLENGAQA